MSAKMKTFFELQKVVDHDCGNYRIGEIDFVDLEAIRKYVLEYGEFAEIELLRVCARIVETARLAGIEQRRNATQTYMDGIGSGT